MDDRQTDRVEREKDNYRPLHMLASGTRKRPSQSRHLANHTIDIQILDYKQCFDSLWLQACLNDAYDSGIQDDSLTLLYNVNKSVNIAIRTPVGQTKRKTINNESPLSFESHQTQP